MNEIKSKNTIDIAVFISLGAGFLFFIGWNYWKNYYGYFGIDQSMINFSFHQVIGSAWSILTIFFFGIIYAIFSPKKRLKTVDDIETTVDKLGLGILVTLYLILFPLINTWWMKLVIILIFLIPFIYIWNKFGDKEIRLGPRLKDFHGKLFLSVTILFFSLFITNQLASIHAKRSAMGISVHSIDIELKFENTSYHDYVLIANMDGKYFISEKTDGVKKPKTIIINNDDVRSATLIAK